MNKLYIVFCFLALSLLGACGQDVTAGCGSSKVQSSSSCSSAGDKNNSPQQQAGPKSAQVDPVTLIRELEALRRDTVAQTPESEKRQKELEQQLAEMQNKINSQGRANTYEEEDKAEGQQKKNNKKKKKNKNSKKDVTQSGSSGGNGLGDLVKNVPSIVNTVGSVISGVKNIFGGKPLAIDSDNPATNDGDGLGN